MLVDPAIGEAGDMDTAMITLTFANGAIGTIDNSRKAVYGYDQRVEVFGSSGHGRGGATTPPAHRGERRRTASRRLPLNFFMERYTEAYRPRCAPSSRRS